MPAKGRLALTLLVLVAGCGDSAPATEEPDTWTDDQAVARYCAYGAVSQAQFFGCLDHVTAEEVDSLDTKAARYARGEITRCGADSGPLCGTAVEEDTPPEP